MARFRKIAIVEANRWWKHGDDPDVEKDKYVWALRDAGKLNEHRCTICKKLISEHGWIDTLEGEHCVCPGDWIIVETNEEKRVCKDKIFEKFYELAEE